MYRDPLPTWVSPQGRIALLGDAAHPFLPTSIQGASQSMEDGATISQVLRLAGKTDVPLALRSYQDIRYDRVRETQLIGEQYVSAPAPFPSRAFYDSKADLRPISG